MRTQRTHDPAVALVMAACLLLNGCSLFGVGGENADRELVGTKWQLIKAETPQGLVRADTLEATVRFTSNDGEADGTHSVSGFDSCNFFSGNYETSGSRLTISDISGSLIACRLYQSKISNALLDALNGASTFELNGDELRIFGASTLYLRSREEGT